MRLPFWLVFWKYTGEGVSLLMSKSIVAGQEAIRISMPDARTEAAARRRARQRRERAIEGGLFLAALTSVATIVTIIAVLLSESVGFFRTVPLTDFFTKDCI